MPKKVKPKVDLYDLIDTLDIDIESLRFFVDKLTGQIVTWCEDEGFNVDVDEIDDDEFIPEHYIPLPDRWDFDKYRIMEDFCHSIDDGEIRYNLLNAIRGKGAYGRFNTAIRCYKIENDWYKFLHEGLKEIAIEFCNEHKLDYEYSPD